MNEAMASSTEKAESKMVMSPDDHDPRDFAPSYQIEASEKALEQNTTVELETENISCEEEQVNYFPGDLVSNCIPHFEELYHCYTITMKQNFHCDVKCKDIILAVKCDLGEDFKHMDFELVVNRGSISINLSYTGTVPLNPEQVYMGTKFQTTILGLLIDRNLEKVARAKFSPQQADALPRVSYLLLPSIDADMKAPFIDWDCASSLFFPTTAGSSSEFTHNLQTNCCHDKSYDQYVHTKDKMVCRCMLNNSLVLTPHNGCVYCITGFLDGVDGRSVLKSKGKVLYYKDYYQSKHDIHLQYEGESLLNGRHIFTVKNCLKRQNHCNDKESSKMFVELPPELCIIISSCMSLDTLYSYSLVPSIMHRVESTLLALNLKRFQINHRTSNIHIPTKKVLEAITTKKCQEEFSLESLETLGDSFLKYTVSQQLFRKHKDHREGLLSTHKERRISNDTLYKLGCARKLQGFIRHECFDPKKWVIPGDQFGCSIVLKETLHFSSGSIYVMGSRRMKNKVIADVVEGLIGAYLIAGGELAALIFMDWLGIEVEFIKEVPNEMQFLSQPESHVNVIQLQSLLKYSFRDCSLLVEALTHGSYQLTDISRCYQRLEFLGDSVLDYLITFYLYNEYPGMSPGKLTDLRSSAVNNNCYALAAVKAGLHKHILASSLLHEQMNIFVENFGHLALQSTYGWESDTTVPKVLGDVIESLAGAILVDSGYNKEIVWNCIRPILEPLATPDNMKLQPIRELRELCQRESYEINIKISCVDEKTSITIEVKADDMLFSDTRTGMNKKTAKRLAAKTVLENLKASK